MEHTTPSPLRSGETAAVAVIALAARTFNLGTFSLWLDEILLALRAQGSLAQTWVACRANAEHPPLSALAMNVLYGLGFSDTAQRLLPIALGVATVVLMARWTASHFGRAAGLFTGLVLAVNAIQVRYSQELRPYAYLLFFAALALCAADRVVERGRLKDTGFLALALAGGLYSHYLGALTAVVLAFLFIPRLITNDRERRRAGLRALGRFGVAVAAATFIYAPWFATMTTLADKSPAGGREAWTLVTAGNRWEVITVGMRDGDSTTWAGVALMLVACIGVSVALRSATGVAVIIGAVAGTVGVEIMLVRAGHWTSARYDLLGGLFVGVLVGMGLGWLAELRPRPLPALVATGLLAAVAWSALHRYAAFGRPDWDRVALAVRAMRRPGEPVFAENEWTRISLAYYLQGPDFERRRGEELAPAAVNGNAGTLALGWPPATCALLVAAGGPLSPAIEQRLVEFPKLAHFFRSDEARVYLLTPPVRQRLYDGGWREIGPAAEHASPCGDAFRIPPPEVRVRAPYLWTRLGRALGRRREAAGETSQLDFDAQSSARSLASGWSGFEIDPDGTTFVWATGRESLLSLWCERPRPRLIRVRLRPASLNARQQTMTALLNGDRLGEMPLDDGFQTVRFVTGASQWKTGENVLNLRFAYTVAPKDVDPRLGDSRPLAAAFDRLDVFER